MAILKAARDDRQGDSDVLIDDADLLQIQPFRWRVTSNGYVYTNRWIGGRTVKFYIHRMLLNPPKIRDVDHKNGDKLDNRRENLRTCSRGENNAAHARVRKGKKSKFRGVTFAKDKPTKPWQAQIGFRGKMILIGRFYTEEEAARAYDARAKELFGEFRLPNFPDA